MGLHSNFVDMAQKGPIEPNSKYLSQGDPLGQAEKFGGTTTSFRGQTVMSVFFPEYF